MSGEPSSAPARAEQDWREADELRSCVRDLVSMVALPALWTGQSQEAIIESIPDVLLTALRLEFAYVRFDRDSGDQPVEAARWDGRASLSAPDIGRWVQRSLFPSPVASPMTIASPFGGEDVRVVASQLAGSGSKVLIVAGARRATFPTDHESIVIRVAGTQVQVGLRSASLLETTKRAEETARLAWKAAQDADRRKDEFLAMLGHELRNPLAPIVTALQLMRLRGVGADREQTVIERQVHHLIRLVDDLLDISRITRGKIELTRRPIELSEIVASAIETASPIFEQRRHHLTVEVPRSGLVVDADAPRLTQVLSNLLANAGKYTPPGGRVELRAARHDGTITISVKDNGIGISAELLPTIFDAFVQEKRTSDRSEGGLGLGLAIVRNLVELHGGTVTASSAGAGKGSEFTVTLAVSTSGESPSATERITQSAAVTRPLSVLVIDDNVDAATLLQEAMELWGHKVVRAHDGPGGLAAVQSFRPDVALVDIGLPVMDGYEVAVRLRSIPELSNLRLIALTGYGQPADRERTRAAGFDEHFVKPIDLDALRATLDERYPASGKARGRGT